MTLAPAEFMRRFLLHVLPAGFHSIRHFGLLANAARRNCLAVARSLLQPPAGEPVEPRDAVKTPPRPTFICRHCGAPMIVIEMLQRLRRIRSPPPMTLPAR